jgi:hypothetical protein
MALTKIDYQVYRGSEASLEKSLYSAINPRQQPGCLLTAAAVAGRDNIGGQVACKLALEHFLESLLDVVAPVGLTTIEQFEDYYVGHIETAFRRANTSVYDFGHKLAAGGRMAASLVGFYLQERVVAIGRAGTVSAYLLRGSEVCPFFTESLDGDKLPGFLGENSIVTVELSSIELRPHDVIIVLPTLLDSEQQAALRTYVFSNSLNREHDLFEIVKVLYPNTENIGFVLQAVIGPEVIYLKQVK